MRLKCPKCNKGILKEGMTSYSEYGMKFGKYPADICTYCKEAWFDEDIAQELENKSKRLGLFGIGRKIKANYDGGLLKIKLPKEFVKNFRLKNSSVIVRPQGKQKLSLQIIAKEQKRI